jgi:nucleoside-diphosphate-sugar epimerase
MADLVLLTGISGFVGGHVSLALLKAGYRVRGSVRDLGKTEKVRMALAKAGADMNQLEFVELDLNSDAGWDEAMRGVRYLQHTASPFVTNMPKDKMELIRPAVDGTRRALNAALAAQVERIVVTSSMAAIAYGHARDRSAPFTGADWTDLTGRGANAYVESKTLAEREAWTIVDSAGRHDDLATINPSVILGPLLDDDAGTSAALLGRLMNGSIPAAARIYFSVVDVRDVADAHVKAMTAPAAGGHRYAIGEKTLSLLEFADVVRAAMPEFARRLPKREVPDWMVRLFSFVDKDIRGNVGELGVVRRVDAREAVGLLGHPLVTAPEAVLATARSLVAQGIVKQP